MSAWCKARRSWSRRISLEHSFPSQINALRCVLKYNFKSIFTDNTDNISGFAWKFEVQPNVFRSSERREIDMKSSPVEKKYASIQASRRETYARDCNSGSEERDFQNWK